MPTLQALLKRREKAKFLLIGHLEPIEDLIRRHDTTTTKSKDYHEIITGKPTLDRKLESLLTVCQELYDQLDISHAEFGTTADLERAISARCSSVAVFIDTITAAEQRHHTALHDDSKVRSSSPNSDSKTNQASVNFTHASRDSTSTEHVSPPRRILLKTAKIRASYRGKEAIANVLFDEGADRSFVTKRFAKSLNANVHNTELLKLKSFNNSQADYTSVPTTSLQLHTRYGKRVLIDVLCVEEISDNLDNNVTSEIANLRYLQGLPLAHPISDESVISIDILIGADRYWDFIGNRVVRGPGPTAVSSSFGFLLSGPLRHGKPRSAQAQTFHITTLPPDDELLDKNVASYWDLESIGIRDTMNSPLEKSTPDEQFKQYATNCLTEENNRFTAKLPWKSSHDPLPTNYDIARNRTRHMIQKLPRDIVYMYDRIISEQLESNYIEQVNEDDNTEGHYLPHRAVKRDSDTTPIRVNPA
ncbi:uncharacterized protein [Ptychodera flava]|uniref:uncharacterized protein n=1 Tax=Ptychodera flava TaxID=63121 RepID=UPI003969DFC6